MYSSMRIFFKSMKYENSNVACLLSISLSPTGFAYTFLRFPSSLNIPQSFTATKNAMSLRELYFCFNLCKCLNWKSLLVWLKN